jgi:hypothetical protein
MSLFTSEIVQKELKVMHELYRSLTKRMSQYGLMTVEEREEFIDDLDALLDKQEVLYTRAYLMDDEDSEQVKENFRMAAKQMGIPSSQVGPEVFRKAKDAMKNLRDHLDFDVDKP